MVSHLSFGNIAHRAFRLLVYRTEVAIFVVVQQWVPKVVGDKANLLIEKVTQAWESLYNMPTGEGGTPILLRFC